MIFDLEPEDELKFVLQSDAATRAQFFAGITSADVQEQEAAITLTWKALLGQEE